MTYGKNGEGEPGWKPKGGIGITGDIGDKAPPGGAIPLTCIGRCNGKGGGTGVCCCWRTCNCDCDCPVEVEGADGVKEDDTCDTCWGVEGASEADPDLAGNRSGEDGLDAASTGSEITLGGGTGGCCLCCCSCCWKCAFSCGVMLANRLA